MASADDVTRDLQNLQVDLTEISFT